MNKSVLECFPVLQVPLAREGGQKRLAYLDSAASTLKPRVLAEAISNYYLHNGTSVHRGVYELSQLATEEFEMSRRKIADFFNVDDNYTVIFTKGTTEAINIIAHGIDSELLGEGDEIVTTEIEHHANLVPWQQTAGARGARLRHIPLDPATGEPDGDAVRDWVSERARVLAITAMSNVTGWAPPLAEMIGTARERGIITVIDGAQYAAHAPVDIAELGCDFFACSAHKLCGPYGLGVLIARNELLERVTPYAYGGHMILDVYKDRSSFRKAPDVFEAGTPHVAGIIGFGQVIDWLGGLDRSALCEHERGLTEYACAEIARMESVRVYGNTGGSGGGAIISFNVADAHAHDVGSILDQEGVAIRVGDHCAQPFHRAVGANSTARASIFFYNTQEDIDQLLVGIRRAVKLFTR